MGLRKDTMGKFPWEQRCQCCGSYVLEGEEFYIIYPDGNKKIEWGIAHCHELDAVGTVEEQIKFLEDRKIPRFKGWTDLQKADASLFYEACCEFGFTQKRMSKRTMKCKKPGTSATICYDMITQDVTFDCRYRRGLFDGFFERELIGKIENKFRELKGLDKKKVETANEMINKAIEEVDILMWNKVRKKDRKEDSDEK